MIRAVLVGGIEESIKVSEHRAGTTVLPAVTTDGSEAQQSQV
ncbi:hypothetical protein SynROS8604_00279 [Synechococcus sp. ROS8604]|nr:hypothetical protein SynROS8604_00279 [Synechococcus sp. ROS8604]